MKGDILEILVALHTKKIAIFRVGPASESLRIVLTIMPVQSEIHGEQKESVILARKTKLYQNDYIYS